MTAVIGFGAHAKALEFLVRGECIDYDAEVPTGVSVLIGIGNNPAVGDSDLLRRKELYERFIGRVYGASHHTCVSDGAVVHKTVQTMARSVINHGATISENCIINTGAIIEHDCVIGAHSHIAPGAVLCGGVVVGELTHIGAGSVVIQGVRIGDRCVVGAGSVVTKDVPDDTTVMGNPARVVT